MPKLQFPPCIEAQGHAPTAQCIVEHESGPRHTTFGQARREERSVVKASVAVLEMQSARMNPSVGRQLLRLGARRSVYSKGTVGLGTRAGLNPHSLQLAIYCASETTPTYLCPATLCQ